MVDISRWQGIGDYPWQHEGGESLEPCEVCGVSTWIEIGGGEAIHVYHPNIDVVASEHTDIVLDLEIANLPFHDEHATVIKAIHSLQHLSRSAARRILKDAYRVLRPGGELRLMVGDFDFIIERLKEDGLIDGWMSCVFHGPDEKDGLGLHKWGYNFKTLTEELEMAGFSGIQHKGWYNAWEFKVSAIKA